VSQLSLVLAAPAAAHASASAVGAGVAAGAAAAASPTARGLLHPALWRAHQLGSTPDATLSSGFALLDAQLPGGGWPSRVLTELLLPHAGVGELRLLAPVLVALQRQQRSVMWLDPPAAPCPWTLAALGLDMQQLVVVQSRCPVRGQARKLLPAADVLWALEQALKSGHLGAVLAWLPARLPADALRRLQLAAQAHDGPAFLLRDAQMQRHASAAPLRLLLASAAPDVLRVQLLKRRGPPLAQPLHLALAPVLSAPELARARAVRELPRAMASPAGAPVTMPL
jgi:protein ImuA